MELTEEEIKSRYFDTMKEVKKQDMKSGTKSRFKLNEYINVSVINNIAKKYSDDVKSVEGPVYSSHVESLDSLKRIVEKIEAGLCKSLHFGQHFVKGRLGLIESSKDGTKIGKPDEYDGLYVAHLPDNWRVEPYDEMGHYNIFDDKNQIVSSRDVFNALADSIDSICSKMTLPPNIRFGGFASESYSGCRINGPAATILLEMDDDDGPIPFSYDITFAFEHLDLSININEKLKVIQSQVRNRQVTRARIHLVPEMNEDRWLASTAEMEAKILCDLEDSTPVKKAIKTAKMIGKDIEGCIAEQIKASELINPPKESSQIQEMLENYQKMEQKEELLHSLWSALRYGHVFLEESVAREHNELTKSVISVNNASLKHSILAMALSMEKSFSSPADGTIVKKLIMGALRNISDGSKTIPHAFLEKLQISTLSVSAITAMVKDIPSLKTIFRKHCQHFVKCSAKISEKQRGKASKRKSSDPMKTCETKRYMRSPSTSRDIVENSSEQYSESPKTSKKLRHIASKRKSSEPKKSCETKRYMKSPSTSRDFVENSSEQEMDSHGNVHQQLVEEDIDTETDPNEEETVQEDGTESETESETDPDMEETIQHALSCDMGHACAFSARVTEKENPFFVNCTWYFIVTASDKCNSARIRINVLGPNHKNKYNQLNVNESYHFSGVLRENGIMNQSPYDFIDGPNFTTGSVGQMDVVEKYAELDQLPDYDPDEERSLNEALLCSTTSIIKGKIIKKGPLKTRREFLLMYLCLRDSDRELPVIFSLFVKSPDEENLYDVGDVIRVNGAKRYKAYWDSDLITLGCTSNKNIQKLAKSPLLDLVPVSNIYELGWKSASYINDEGKLRRYKVVSCISAHVYTSCPNTDCENIKLEDNGHCRKCGKTCSTSNSWYAYVKINAQTCKKGSTCSTVTLFLDNIAKCCPISMNFETRPTEGKLKKLVVNFIPFYCRASSYESNDQQNPNVLQVYDVVSKK